MSVSLILPFGAGWQAFTNGGLPLNGGLLYTYQAGGTTPQATYTTSTGLIQNANPIVLDASGRPPNEIWVTDQVPYRFDLKDSAGSLIKTYDNLNLPISSLAYSGGSSLIGFIASGTGATARTVQSKLRDIISAADFDTLQHAITAAAGKTLDGAGASYTITTALTLPSNILIQNLNLVANESSGNLLTATSVSNITFRNVNVTSLGNYSPVMTFALCNQLNFEDCIFNAKVGSALGSIALRSQGSTNINIHNCQFYDADSFVYLDASSGTNSDYVRVLNSLFQHTFLGATNNPTGVYQFNCNNVFVDGCTFIDIAAGGGAPIAGYSVYEGDGSAVSCTVTNCITKMTQVKAHVMVQNANAPYVSVTNNKFYGAALGSGATTSNFLIKSSCQFASTLVQGNYCQEAAIFIVGGGIITRSRAVYIHDNQLIKCSQPTSGIRIGVAGVSYVGFASIKDNTIYCTTGGSINLSQFTYAVVENNHCMNWNTANNVTHTAYAYTAGIYVQGATPTCVLRGNFCENDATVGGDSGFCRVGIALDNLSVTTILIDNAIGSMLDSRTVKTTEGGYAEDGAFHINSQTAIPTLSEPNQIAFSYDNTGTGTLTIYVRNTANSTTHSANIALS